MVQRKRDSVKELKHIARRRSIAEGIFSSAKTHMGERYIQPFAIAINTSNPMVALLTSASGLLGSFGQLFGSRLIEKHSRKKIVLTIFSLQLLFWASLTSISFLFYKGIITETLPIFLLTSFAIYAILSGLAHPAWFSWTGDIVDTKFRGRWFSKRNLITGVVGGVLVISSAVFLDFLKKNNWLMIGFMILFALAFIFRLISCFFVSREYEPKIKIKKRDYFSFWQFLKKAPKNNFGKLSIFRGLFEFSAAISGSLLAVYLLRYLEFNYFLYILTTLAGSFFSFFIINLWGKISDRYGNYRIILITTLLIPIIPILWILNSSPVYLILVPSLISGTSWTGFHLASGNFIYDNVHKEKRGLAISYHNLLLGLGVSLGAGVGALLIKYLNTRFLEPIILIFIISSIASMIMVWWWIPKLKEVRKTKKFGNIKNLSHIILKEAGPSLHEEMHQLTSIRKYLYFK